MPRSPEMVADPLGYGGLLAGFGQARAGFADALAMAHGVLADARGPVAVVGSETGSVSSRRDRSQLVNMLQTGDAAPCIVVPGTDTGPDDWLENLGVGCMSLDVCRPGRCCQVLAGRVMLQTGVEAGQRPAQADVAHGIRQCVAGARAAASRALPDRRGS